MITAAATAQQQREFARRIAGKPYFDAYLGTSLALFGQKPGSGWQFYLLPGNAALALRGEAAYLCGALPEADDREELASFLGFLGIARVLCESTEAAPLGWQPAKPLYRYALGAGECLPLPPTPAEVCSGALRLERSPSMWQVSQLLFPESEEERAGFYSTACTSIAHGVGRCLALFRAEDGIPVCAVGAFERSDTEAYMAAGKTLPNWRGRGLAGWLIVQLAIELAAEGVTAAFLCEEQLCGFYNRLEFQQKGEVYRLMNPDGAPSLQE